MNMISYASLERLEGEYAVCEVEQLSVFDSKVGDFSKECYMVDIPIMNFKIKGIPAIPGNVYSVEHDGNEVIRILRKEDAETKRRKEWIRSMRRKD